MSENSGADDHLKQSFQKVLNQHGYGFQYSILKQAWELSGRSSKWIFQAAEFPVEVQGTGTRIDFVLSRLNDYKDSGAFYLLAECKRANPALSNWCFARAPYVHEDRVYGFSGYDPLIIDFTELDERNAVQASAKTRGKLENAYHVGVEVKSGVKGDSQGKSSQAIEDAATQVSRGLNGMIQFVLGNRQFLSEGKIAHFLPVIFTTANIWITDADLSRADIRTGNIDLKDASFTRKPWIAFQYHLSPGLKHSASPQERSASLSKIMDSEYVRTIPIVSAEGVESFLKWSSQINLRW